MIATAPAVEAGLPERILAHLRVQIDSAARLLACVLAQGSAIRARDVEAVLARLTDLKHEMARRASLEHERSALLARAGLALGIAPEAVTIDALATLMPAPEAEHARRLSSELRGLLAEVAREHGINRALMRQELSFLDHLVRLIAGEPDPGYSPGGGEQRPSVRHVYDFQA